jgi:hypothetical protein
MKKKAKDRKRKLQPSELKADTASNSVSQEYIVELIRSKKMYSNNLIRYEDMTKKGSTKRKEKLK